MNRFPFSFGLVAVCLLTAAERGALGQSGPGLPNLVYDGSELFQEITLTQEAAGLHGHSMMFDGYLAVVRYGPGGVEFYDLANPYAPVLVQSISNNMADMTEPHTFAQTTYYGGKHVLFLRGAVDLGGTGFSIWDWTDLSAPVHLEDYDVPQVPGGYATGTFWLFYQAPYVFCGVGSLGLAIVDASDPQNPFVAKHMPTSQTGGFNAVNTLAVGNLLILTNADGGPGMARLDISDPLDPQLLASSTNTPIPYGVQFNGGRIQVPAVSGPVSSPTGGNGHFEVIDPFSGFSSVNKRQLPSRGGSAVVQDEFVHVAASTAYEKIDVSDDANYVIVGIALLPYAGGDWDWVTPIGNLVALGDDQLGGTSLVVHDLLPDNDGPLVTMVIPEDNALNQALSSRVGITTSDMIELASLDTTTFTLRPVGGAALAGSYSNQFGIVNFTPAQPLEPNTSYEIVIPVGGIRDWSGNPTPETFISRFSTGNSVQAIDVTAQAPAPVPIGQTATFDVDSVVGTGPFTYSWDFGDGTPPTPYSSSSAASHTYLDAGHYSVLVSVTDGTITSTDSFVQTVHYPLTLGKPTRSSTIAMDETNGLVWCVNADNDTVTIIDSTTFVKQYEVAVGDNPRTLAQAPDGTMWVVCQDDATIDLLELGNPIVDTIALPYASAPYGIAMSPDGSAAYVTLRGTGEVAKLDIASRTLLDTVAVGTDPKGIAIDADAQRIFVTRFRSSSEPTSLSSLLPKRGAGTESSAQGSPLGGFGRIGFGTQPAAEVYELSASTFSKVRSIPLAMDDGPDTDASGRGLPNYLSSLCISPDGRRLWVPSKKDNIQRGLFRDGLPLTFQNTVRAIVSQIDLATSREVRGARVDFNDRDMAFAVEFSPLGDYAFHALQGSNVIDVRDAYTGAIVASVIGTGLAPQGLVMKSDGSTLFVHNFMSRTIAVYDIGGVTASSNFFMRLVGNVPTVATEVLTADVLRGKQVFYNGSDPRMNEDGYLSCATCHLEGDDDGQTWDFTDRGEGLRNTIALIGKAGLGQGNVHWTANFDEIQDFENDMRSSFGGDGFMEEGLFQSGTVSEPLGQPKAGLSSELDALAAYVSSLSQFGLSPHRNSDGTLSAAGVAGKAVFEQSSCSQCHSGPGFTNSSGGLLFDVGTLQAGSGQAMGGPLVGLDTPTLRGLWATAPYLHDGSALTLLDVLTKRNPGDLHGVTSTLTTQELEDLVAYLLQIDDLEPAPAP